MTTPVNLRPDAFVGTAQAYALYRPAYPAAMLAELLDLAGTPPGAALLDIACGPGRITLDLAPAFETVWAIDLEPEMVEVGKAAAARRGVGNISWFVGRAEDLDAPPGAFDLITIGEAFHRLDQPLVTRKALGWLKPGGGLATMGGG
jgi:ubiquinone/menaquinone biosynthesis C-methylase UbiE